MIPALELYPHFAHALGLLALLAWYLGVVPRNRWQPRFLPLALYTGLALAVELARWAFPVLLGAPDPIAGGLEPIVTLLAVALLLWSLFAAEAKGSTLPWPLPARIPIVLHCLVAYGAESYLFLSEHYEIFGVCAPAVTATMLLATHITVNLLHTRRSGVRIHWSMVIAVLVAVAIGFFALRAAIESALVRSEGRLLERARGIAAAFDPVEMDRYAAAPLAPPPARLQEVLERVRTANPDALHVSLLPANTPESSLHRYPAQLRRRFLSVAEARQDFALFDEGRTLTALARVRGIDRVAGVFVFQLDMSGRSAALHAAVVNTHLWVAFISSFMLGCMVGYQRFVSVVDRRAVLLDATAHVSERLANGEDPLITSRWLVTTLQQRLDGVRADLWLAESREGRPGFVIVSTSPESLNEGEWFASDELPAAWHAALQEGNVIQSALPAGRPAPVLESARHASRVIAEPILGSDRPWGALVLFHSSATLLHSPELQAALRTIASTFSTALARQERITLLRAAEERLRLIIGASIDGFWDVDHENHTSHHSPRWWDMLGYSPGSLPDTFDSVHGLFHPEDLPGILALCAEKLPAGVRSVQMQFRARHCNGTWRWIESSAVQLRSAHGPAQRMLGFDRDITDRREANERLQQALAIAERANQTKSDFLASMSHELRTPLNSVIGFASLLLRSPLSPRQREWVEASQSSAEHLLALINDLLDLSKIEAGRLELRPAVFELRTLVEEVLGTFAKDTGDKKIALDYRLADITGPAWVFADELRLRQVLTNLVGNAVKFTPAGRVWVEIRQHEPEHWTFEVHDTGPGMAAENLARLFQRFSQLDPERSRQGGTGLGLAISRELALQMGGDITAQSLVGQGSTFRFQVKLTSAHGPARRRTDAANLSGLSAILWEPHPVDSAVFESMVHGTGLNVVHLGDEDAVMDRLEQDHQCIAVFFPRSFEPTRREVAARLRAARTVVTDFKIIGFHTPADTAPSGQDFDVLMPSPIRQRAVIELLLGHASGPADHAPALEAVDPGAILVAEDHPSNRLVMEAMLGSLNCKADFVEDGAQAVEALRARPYKVALLDVSMPIMDGIAVARWVRDEWPLPWPRPRLVAVTAFASRGDRERFISEGMDDYLPKPILREALHAVLSPVHADPQDEAGAVTEPVPLEDVDWKRLEALLETVNARRNAASFRRIVANFSEQATASLDELARIPDDDPPAAKRALHRFKGALSTLSLQAAAVIVAEAHDSGRLPPLAARTRWIENLRATIERSLQAINARYPWLNEQDA